MITATTRQQTPTPIPTANIPKYTAMATPETTQHRSNYDRSIVLRHLVRSSFSLSNAGLPSLYFNSPSTSLFSYLLNNFQA